MLRALDWLGRLEIRDFTQTPDDEMPAPRNVAMQGAPMRTSSGDVLIGYPALRRALRQTPLGIVPSLVMYLPGVSHVGARIYGAVASRRARSLGCASSNRAAAS